jgi:hypothetical protein
MNAVILLIITILAIVRAVRKAQREQQRRMSVPAAKGPVTPPETSVSRIAERWQSMSRETDEETEDIQDEVPAEIKLLLERSRRTKRQEAADESEATYAYEQTPQTIPAPTQDAYDQPAVIARRGISFDKESLRTFFVTREILGTPRSRSPYRPGVRK